MSTARRRASHTIAVVPPGLRPFFLSDQHGLIARIFSAFLFFFHTQAAAKAANRIAVAASLMTQSSDGREGPRRAEFFFSTRTLSCSCTHHRYRIANAKGRRRGFASEAPSMGFCSVAPVFSVLCPSLLRKHAQAHPFAPFHSPSRPHRPFAISNRHRKAPGLFGREEGAVF